MKRVYLNKGKPHGYRSPLAERFAIAYRVVESGCWEWQGYLSPKGYGAIQSDGANILRAHHAAWILHCGPIPAGMYVLHQCDNRRCVNPGHLFLGTQADNVADMCAKGRQRTNPKRILSAAQIPAIRERLAKGETLRSIAEDHGVSLYTIHDIKRGHSWRSA